MSEPWSCPGSDNIALVYEINRGIVDEFIFNIANRKNSRIGNAVQCVLSTAY